MSTYSQLKALQNYDCDDNFDCNKCALCSRNNGYDICCSFLSEEQIKEIANKIDAKEKLLLPAEEVPLNEEEISKEKKLRSGKMSTYAYLKTLQNYNCYDDCDNCVLSSKNNGYDVGCSSLSEEQLKEIAHKIDTEKSINAPTEETPLNEEETSKEKYKQFVERTDRWKDFKYNIRVLTKPDASYRPIMREMECCGVPLTKLYTNCTIENFNGCGIGMLWITTGDGALLYIPWDMIVSIQPIGEKE